MTIAQRHRELSEPSETVLVVGDDPIGSVVPSLREGIQNVTVAQVETAERALDRLDTDVTVATVVVCQELPDGSGVALSRRIRRRRPNLPIVLVGTDVSAATERDAFEAGVTDVARLGSGADGDEVLCRRIERALSVAEPRRARQRAADTDRALAGAHATFQELFAATTVEEVADVVAAAAATWLGATGAEVFLPDRSTTRLHRVAWMPGSLAGPASVAADADSPLWDAYVAGEAKEAGESTAEDDTASGSALVVPLDQYGVLRIHFDEATAVDGPTRRLVALLSSVAAVAFRRETLRRTHLRRMRELDARLARIGRLADLSELLVRVDRAVAAADGRAELERRVCEELVDDGTFPFAWIGAVGDDDRVVPRASAGDPSAYLDAVDLALDDADGDPAIRAVRTRSPTLVDDVSSGDRHGAWREHALARGLRSAYSVPLVHDGELHGVIAVYGADPGTFDDSTTAAMDDVADAVARAIATRKRQHALRAETVLDLELELPDGADLFGRVADRTGATLTLEEVVEREQSLLAFLVVAGDDASAVASALAAEDPVESVDGVARGEDVLFEVVLVGPSLVTGIGEAGGTLRRLTADGEVTELHVTLPVETDVRGFVESLHPFAGDVRLRSRTHRPRASGPDRRSLTRFEDAVTDRQSEALRTAYLSGYFEWPRQNTAQEVAERLDISQPTFNRHMRMALREFLSILFEPDER